MLESVKLNFSQIPQIKITFRGGFLCKSNFHFFSFFSSSFQAFRMLCFLWEETFPTSSHFLPSFPLFARSYLFFLLSVRVLIIFFLSFLLMVSTFFRWKGSGRHSGWGFLRAELRAQSFARCFLRRKQKTMKKPVAGWIAGFQGMQNESPPGGATDGIVA